MKFTEEQTSQFVLSYKNHPCLYDNSHPDYKIKHAREAAMWDMISELKIKGLTIDEIKKKIKSLRSTYYLELEKIQKMKNMGQDYTSKLKWFDDMSSVFCKYKVRRSSSFLYSETATPSLEEYENETATNEYMEAGQQSNVEESFSMAVIKPTSSRAQDPARIKHKIEEKKEESRPKRTDTVAEIYHNLKKEMRKSNVQDSNNEYDIYGKYVAASLKKLSNEQAIYAQNVINNVLTKAKMRDLDGGQVSIYKVVDSNEESDESVDD